MAAGEVMFIQEGGWTPFWSQAVRGILAGILYEALTRGQIADYLVESAGNGPGGRLAEFGA